LKWEYPQRAATAIAAKTSVTEVRRRLAEEMDDEAEPFLKGTSVARLSMASRSARRATLEATPHPASGHPLPSSDEGRGQGEGRLRELSASETGTAHHVFLQHVDLKRTGDVEALRAEARRLVEAAVLTEEQAAALDFDALAAFWSSATGLEIRQQAAFVRRELPFTARFSPEELQLTNPVTVDEFVVVQGVADLVVLLPEEIWLVDFKTDDVSEADLPERARHYQPQIQLYSKALARAFGRPVTRRCLYFLAVRSFPPTGHP
jgi:ATP-dependent helicase/nuclease subunit A